MSYIEHIRRALDYIEENLTQELKLPDLARAAGYSQYHFLRIFREVTGLTPADYIRKRRICEIVREMELTKRPMSDIAFDYDFSSKENFTRAFKAEHGILPSEHKAARNSLKLYERPALEARPLAIEPAIVTLKPFSVVAYPSDEAAPPNFWNKYNAKKWSLKLTGGIVCEDYGVGLWSAQAQRLDYFCGVRREHAKGDTRGTVSLRIPGGTYAVFETPAASHMSFVNAIHDTWAYINRVWLPKSAYRHAGGYEFETYLEAGRTFREKIHIPLEHR